MTPKSGSHTPSSSRRLRKDRLDDDNSATVVRAFGTLVKRRGRGLPPGKHAVAVDGTIGGHRSPVAKPGADSDSHNKSKRQQLDEKARAYSKFCKTRS